jgi:hypothetical protein
LANTAVTAGSYTNASGNRRCTRSFDCRF